VATGVRFDGVWKKFRRGEMHDSLRDLIPAVARRFVKTRGVAAPLRDQEFWAVRDVSFDVGVGHALGIMGPNGAGKSTILKLLTKILRPDRGVREVHGRMGMLIEIAAGFHPDLTGRENVFLQGAIMGMKRVDIARKFDEIVAFSEIEDFIDTPVKRYSSGMNARLGFAIAAHVDPDVLIIDEVLAVGDFRFQDKAFGRIQSMCRSGIPVVLVTHQLDRIATLCTEAMLIDHGQVRLYGTPSECIQEYTLGAASVEVDTDGCSLAIDRIVFEDSDLIQSGDRFTLHLGCTSTADFDSDDTDLVVSVRSASSGAMLFSTGALPCEVQLPRDREFEVALTLQANLAPGLYHVDTGVWDRTKQRISRTGPSRMLTVQPGARPFGGTVQLNAEMAVHRTVAPLTEGSIEPSRLPAGIFQ
jgi:ABC-type polysaccharide/polyol phosphate transport system ATPase subunit